MPKPYPKPVPVHPKLMIPAHIISMLSKKALMKVKVEETEVPAPEEPAANATVVATKPAPLKTPEPVPTFTVVNETLAFSKSP